MITLVIRMLIAQILMGMAKWMIASGLCMLPGASLNPMANKKLLTASVRSFLLVPAAYYMAFVNVAE